MVFLHYGYADDSLDFPFLKIANWDNGIDMADIAAWAI